VYPSFPETSLSVAQTCKNAFKKDKCALHQKNIGKSKHQLGS